MKFSSQIFDQVGILYILLDLLDASSCWAYEFVYMESASSFYRYICYCTFSCLPLVCHCMYLLPSKIFWFESAYAKLQLFFFFCILYQTNKHRHADTITYIDKQKENENGQLSYRHLQVCTIPFFFFNFKFHEEGPVTDPDG